MFRIRSISLCHGRNKKDFVFTDHAFIFGRNSVGKTAFTKVIDYILGSSEDLAHDGLDGIDEVRAYLENEKTKLWIKRNLQGEYFYKRTYRSGYSQVSADTYKDNICNVITQDVDIKAIKVYKKAFEENPTFRSFTFINFVDEIGQGDLGSIFTRGKEVKHIVRIRKIMDFFFNYENIEKIYEKRVELESLELEQNRYKERLAEYSRNLKQIEELFSRLGLSYSDRITDNYDTFRNFRDGFSRKKNKPSGDLVYLTKASYSLSEELKLYSYIKQQSNLSEERKKRTERLLSVLKAIEAENEEYKDEVKVIEETISGIQQDRIILSLTDYDASIKKIAEEKKKIDGQIELLKNQSRESDYESTLKIIALLDNSFRTVEENADIRMISILPNQIVELKKHIKALSNNYSQKMIDDFNLRLTDMYLKSDIKNVEYINDDRNEMTGLEFDPFSQVLVAKHKEGENIVAYTPGSLARHNHLQLLVYLCMFEHLYQNFRKFIYLPILVIDSANQAMDDSSFEEIYPSLIENADRIGVQTIFMSKTKPQVVNESDLIDISEGLNPFHQQQEGKRKKKLKKDRS